MIGTARPAHPSSRRQQLRMEPKSYDLVIIGSGPAGEKGATQAAYFGKTRRPDREGSLARRGLGQHRDLALEDAPGNLAVPVRVPEPGALRAPLLAQAAGQRPRLHGPRALHLRHRAGPDPGQPEAAQGPGVLRDRLVRRPPHRRDQAVGQPRGPDPRREVPDRHRVVALPAADLPVPRPPGARLRHDPHPPRHAGEHAGLRRRRDRLRICLHVRGAGRSRSR